MSEETSAANSQRRRRRTAAERTARIESRKPRRHGADWSAVDDDALVRFWTNSDCDPTIAAVAEKFGRSTSSIASRLVKVGLFPDREAARSESRRREASATQMVEG